MFDEFETNVWGADPVSEPAPTPTPVTTAEEPESADDFDEFGETAQISQDDDDFGDFGDEQTLESAGFGDTAAFPDERNAPGPSSHPSWEPLRLDPLPPRATLTEHVHSLLAPIFPDDVAAETSSDPIRDVEGVNQVLVTQQSRDLYNVLLKSPPPTKPPNWTRSKIRRQQLITLGIPVNLDEVLPTANGKALPPLQISTRPMSAPPAPRSAPGTRPGSNAPSASNSRAGTPQPGGRATMPALGPKPELDNAKIKELLELEAESLTLQPLPQLERYLTDLRSETANASSLLTHLMQVKDALQQDSETYNGLIAELVGEAQKIKTGKAKNPTRRGSGVQ